MRYRVFEREQGACQMCGEEGQHVHHMTYARFGNENLKDLQLLCESCHIKIHHR